MPNLNQFDQVVYPVGITDLRPFLHKKSIITLYCISTKIGTVMYFNGPFMCTKFQLDKSMCLHFVTENAKGKKEKELRDYFKILLARFLESAGVICFKFGV